MQLFIVPRAVVQYGDAASISICSSPADEKFARIGRWSLARHVEADVLWITVDEGYEE